ncbi:MAG TPA: hypothetical protein VL334_07400 [Anaerolineae bacterium]|nr:hypothetical protein [Anaerolineae bacterium]
MSRPSSISQPLLALAFVLFFPSTAVVQRYLGMPGVALYLAAASVLLWLGQRFVFPWVTARIPPRWAAGLLVASFLALAALFLALYPIANSGVVGGGSDGDDALDVAASALLQGQYPYYPRTYLGNPISPLPGSVLLATPFVAALGGSADQNLLWLALFFVTMGVALRSAGQALLLLWVMLLLSPALLHALAIGSDYIANGLFVLLFAWWLLAWASRPSGSILVTVLLAALLGVALASRAQFILLLPLIFSALGRRVGWRPAAGLLAVSIGTLAAVTLPFLLYDPAGFTPLGTYREIGIFDAVLPGAGVGIALATALAGLALAWQDNGQMAVFLRNCTAVLALPVVCGVVLMSIGLGRIDFSFAAFGVMFLFFGAAAFWSASRRPDQSR